MNHPLTCARCGRELIYSDGRGFYRTRDYFTTREQARIVAAPHQCEDTKTMALQETPNYFTVFYYRHELDHNGVAVRHRRGYDIFDTLPDARKAAARYLTEGFDRVVEIEDNHAVEYALEEATPAQEEQ